MGYSIDEWFDDCGFQILEKAMDKIKEIKKAYENEDYSSEKSPFDVFKNALDEMISSSGNRIDHAFSRCLFNLIFQEHSDIKDIVREVFHMVTYYEKSIKELVYEDDRDRVHCIYNFETYKDQEE